MKPTNPSDEPIRIRAIVRGHTIIDIPIGDLFLVEGFIGKLASVDASEGATVQIIENKKPILERTYTERQLYPHKDPDD